ncbi:HAD family hydrolase [Acrocarpospora pleiomorpha]|uniref:HAD family hydrolase n=1 Tax=Acrocarpospora pleiomorpha TaxID=90975 RepID=UPI0012D356D6|nr:HAD-IA family hydrolase [Acrocarpospora pleiomorpha]
MPTIDLTRINTVIFDTDGVVTDTARMHAAAWKHVFDTFMKGRSEPFDIRADYQACVDGRPRLDGVRTFLASRGITLPEGGPSDTPGAPTVHGLGMAKDQLYILQVERDGVAAFPSTVTLLHELRRRGCRTGVVSASRHCRKVVLAAGLVHLFDVLVDGNDMARLGLPGKPDPALFLEAAARLGVPPGRTAIVEDALPGVEAGRRGGFGLIIAVDRAGQAAALAERGADILVTDLDELAVSGRVPVGAG